MNTPRVCLLCTLVAPLGSACSDDIPEVMSTGSSDTGGTSPTTTPANPTDPMGSSTDGADGTTLVDGTTEAGTAGTTGTGTTGVGTAEDGTTGTGTTEMGTTQMGTTEASTTQMGSSTGGSTETGSTSMGQMDDTIYEIQDGTIPTGAAVDVQGVIVTGVGGSGFFAQEPGGGQYSGVYVYLAAMPPVVVGDEVDIIGTTEEFNDLTEINAQMGTVTPTGVTGLLPAPALVTPADLTVVTGEPWEGVLVRIEGMPLAVVNLPGFSEFDVNAGGVDDARVDNFLYSVFDFPGTYPDFGVGASFTAIQGPLNYTFGAFKLAPRDAMDLEGYMGGPPAPGESVDNLVPGDLVVTEVMFDPNCVGDDCEWIEIYNASGIDVNLLGLRIQDSGLSPANQGTITVDVLLPAGGYAVLARGDAGVWPYMIAPAAYYGGNPGFNNGVGGDLVAILNAAEILDQTATYPTFGVMDNGISWKLDPLLLDAVSNDDPLNWCFSPMVFDSPGMIDEYGSPGGPNEAACAIL